MQAHVRFVAMLLNETVERQVHIHVTVLDPKVRLLRLVSKNARLRIAYEAQRIALMGLSGRPK
jgi:hypothetical protein